MKTQLTSARKLLALTAVAFALTMTSCQKDEMATVSGSDNNISARRTLDNPLPVVPAEQAMLKIDHIAQGSAMADYSVSLYRDGSVLFDGRKNVSYIGRMQLKANAEMMNAINELILKSEFFSIREKAMSDDPAIAMTVTTYTMFMQSSDDAPLKIQTKSITDYNTGEPKALVSLRSQVETLLNIADLTGF